jgi:hypothetical protein
MIVTVVQPFRTARAGLKACTTMNHVRACAPLLVLLLIACRPGPVSPHYAVGDEAGTLRADFNAAAGHVRVLMIVAPT